MVWTTGPNKAEYMKLRTNNVSQEDAIDQLDLNPRTTERWESEFKKTPKQDQLTDWNIKKVSIYTSVCILLILLLCFFIWGMYKFYRWVFPSNGNEDNSTSMWEEKIIKFLSDMEYKFNKIIKEVEAEAERKYQEKLRLIEENYKQLEEDERQKRKNAEDELEEIKRVYPSGVKE